MINKISIGLIAIFIAIQFFQPAKNISDINTYHISNKYTIPENVSAILRSACYDCHSNKTAYPWYAKVQPVAWFLNDHVTEGKEHLNFSEFTNMPLARQNHKLEEMVEMVEEKEMPLASYTNLGLHQEADLSDAQREVIIIWAKSQMDLLKATYPADSLVMKKRT